MFNSREAALARAQAHRAQPVPTVDKLEGLADILDTMGGRAIDADSADEMLGRPGVTVAGESASWSVAENVLYRRPEWRTEGPSAPIYYSAESAVWAPGCRPMADVERVAQFRQMARTLVRFATGSDADVELTFGPADRLKLNGSKGDRHGCVSLGKGGRPKVVDTESVQGETPAQRKVRRQKERRAAQRAELAAVAS